MNLKGKDFEAIILFRAQKMEVDKVLTLGRYGVNVVMVNDETGVPRWQPIPSLPDMEGVIYGSGRQLIIEAKVCSASSYPLYSTGKKRPKQIEHMLRRAGFGALCYLMIHFNARELKRSSQPAITYAIQIKDNHFWREYQNCERKTLDRSDCDLYGIKVPWNLYSTRASKESPDLTYLLPDVVRAEGLDIDETITNPMGEFFRLTEK